MSPQVKVGQVWKNKVTGSRWEVLGPPDPKGRWPILRLDEWGEKAMTEQDLNASHALVKEVAP